MYDQGAIKAVYGAVHGAGLRWGRTEDDLYATLPEALEALKSAGSVDWVRQVYGDEVAIHAWEPVCLDAREVQEIFRSVQVELESALMASFGNPVDLTDVTRGRLYDAIEAAVLEVPYADRAHVQTGTVIVDLAEAQARGWL